MKESKFYEANMLDSGYRNSLNCPNRGQSYHMKTSEAQKRLQLIRRKYDSPHLKNSRDSDVWKNKLILNNQAEGINQSIISEKDFNFSSISQQLNDIKDINFPTHQRQSSMSFSKNAQKASYLKQDINKIKNTYLQKNKYEETGKILNGRTDTIDKINSKIKYILNNLHGGQKENSKHYEHKRLKTQENIDSKYNQQIRNAKYNNNISNHHEDYYQIKYGYKNKISDKFSQKFKYPPQVNTNLKFENSKKGQFQNFNNKQLINIHNNQRKYKQRGNYELKLDSQFTKIPTEGVQAISFSRRGSFINKMEDNSKIKQQNLHRNIERVYSEAKMKDRAKSFIFSSKAHKQQDQKSQITKFDAEIQKIEQRIKTFEQQKKKLNIDFVPYERRSKHFEQPTKKQTLEQLPNIKRDISVTYFRNLSQNLTKSVNLTNDYSKIVEEQKLTKRNQEQRSTKRNQEQKNSHRNEASLTSYSQNLKRKANQGILQRKKMLQTIRKQNMTDCQNALKRLVKVFTQQVKLDQQVRNGKSWLYEQYHQDKQSKLQDQFSKFGIEKSKEEIRVQFSKYQEQNNPFFTTRQCNQSYNSLAQNYITAEQHWKNNIVNQFERSQIQGVEMEEKIDLQRKGYIILQDVVRFLNMQTQIFYRNRDLILIYRRLCSSSSKNLSFDELLNVICS